MNTLEAIIPWNEQTQTGDSGQTSANKINGNFSELKNESERIDSNVNSLSYYPLDFTTNIPTTRLLIPLEKRKQGTAISYFTFSLKFVVEIYNYSEFDDASWTDDQNWFDVTSLSNNVFSADKILDHITIESLLNKSGTYIFYDATVGLTINGITYNSGYVNIYKSANGTGSYIVQEFNTINGQTFIRNSAFDWNWKIKTDNNYVISTVTNSLSGGSIKTIQDLDNEIIEKSFDNLTDKTVGLNQNTFRLLIPTEKRFKGHILTYTYPVDSYYKSITEKYIGNSTDDNSWKNNSNWEILYNYKELTATTAINIAEGVNNLDLTLPAGYIIDEIIINNIETNLSGLKCVVDPTNTNISILYDKYLSDSYVGYCFKTLGDQIIYQVDKTIRFNCLGNTGMTVIVKIKTGY